MDIFNSDRGQKLSFLDHLYPILPVHVVIECPLTSKQSGRLFQIFLAFSEYLNFKARSTCFTTCFHLCTCNHDSIKRRVFEGKIIRKVYDIIRSIFYQVRQDCPALIENMEQYIVRTKYRSLYNYLSYIMQQWHEMSDYFG